MSFPVYSERFIICQAVAGYFTYTVPAGHRAVIKCITALNFGTAASTFSCSISGSTLVFESLPGGAFRTYTQLHVPAYASEFVRMETSSATMALSCSGFLFASAGEGRAARPVHVLPWEEGPPLEVEALPADPLL